MRAEGFGGELRHGYAVAARLGSWSLSPADSLRDAHVVTIVDLDVDPYLGRQRPLQLVLRLGELSWTWDDAVLEGKHVLIEGAPTEGVKVLHGT